MISQRKNKVGGKRREFGDLNINRPRKKKKKKITERSLQYALDRSLTVSGNVKTEEEFLNRGENSDEFIAFSKKTMNSGGVGSVGTSIRYQIIVERGGISKRRPHR